MLNVYEQIDTNKRRTWLIMVGFVLFISSFVYLIGYLLNTDPGLIVLAILFSLFSSIGGYFWGDKLILNLSQAKPATREKNFNFYTAAENLAIATQIPTPKLYVINSQAMNAFATGRDPEHATVCVTTGLLNKLDKSELEAVIAHEISHIINFDIRLMTIVAVLVGSISLLSNWVVRSKRQGTGKRKRSSNASIIGIVGLMIAPLIAKLIQLALSRQREYFADASAAKLTRQPDNLITALKKISRHPIALRSANTATAHLFISNPLKKSALSKVAGLFSTHPPVEERIAKLRQML